jgi:hypothetical protein
VRERSQYTNANRPYCGLKPDCAADMSLREPECLVALLAHKDLIQL